MRLKPNEVNTILITAKSILMFAVLYTAYQLAPLSIITLLSITAFTNLGYFFFSKQNESIANWVYSHNTNRFISGTFGLLSIIGMILSLIASYKLFIPTIILTLTNLLLSIHSPTFFSIYLLQNIALLSGLAIILAYFSSKLNYGDSYDYTFSILESVSHKITVMTAFAYAISIYKLFSLGYAFSFSAISVLAVTGLIPIIILKLLEKIDQHYLENSVTAYINNTPRTYDMDTVISTAVTQLFGLGVQSSILTLAFLQQIRSLPSSFFEKYPHAYAFLVSSNSNLVLLDPKNHQWDDAKSFVPIRREWLSALHDRFQNTNYENLSPLDKVFTSPYPEQSSPSSASGLATTLAEYVIFSDLSLGAPDPLTERIIFEEQIYVAFTKASVDLLCGDNFSWCIQPDSTLRHLRQPFPQNLGHPFPYLQIIIENTLLRKRFPIKDMSNPEMIHNAETNAREFFLKIVSMNPTRLPKEMFNKLLEEFQKDSMGKGPLGVLSSYLKICYQDILFRIFSNHKAPTLEALNTPLLTALSIKPPLAYVKEHGLDDTWLTVTTEEIIPKGDTLRQQPLAITAN